MQLGFAAKQAKNKAKKAKAKAKKQARTEPKAGDDVTMGDATPASAAEASMTGNVEEAATEIDYTMPSKHKDKVALKRALKVKVRQLKQNRQKLSKKPGASQTARKQVNEQLKTLIQEQQVVNAKAPSTTVSASSVGGALKKSGKKKKAKKAASAPPAGKEAAGAAGMAVE